MGKWHLSQNCIQNCQTVRCIHIEMAHINIFVPMHCVPINLRFLLFKTVSIFTEILSVDSNQPIVVYHFFYSFGPSISSVRFFLRNGAFEVTFREQIIRLVPFSKTYRLFFCCLPFRHIQPENLWLWVCECLGPAPGMMCMCCSTFQKWTRIQVSVCVCVRRCLTEWESKSESESHKTH